MYLDARKAVSISREAAAEQLFVSERTLKNYEDGITTPEPSVVVLMNQVYENPQISAQYCKHHCEIGKKFCYEILDNVDLSPISILVKYRQEAKEANEALEVMFDILINKQTKADCTDDELKELRRASHELLDLEHVIETMKFRLWNFLDVEELVRDHNQKCIEREYVKKEKDTQRGAQEKF